MSERIEIQRFPLWDRLKARRAPVSFDVELTARCNNDCRHCYINLPAGDSIAMSAELSSDEILRIAAQAADMGAVWCLLTGGEPLLREDFEEVYLGLKRLGLLVSVFTNACLVTPHHVELFKRYPPRDVEVSVYGATRTTYERVTRREGSFEAFVRGLGLLRAGGIPVSLKAIAMRSTLAEMDDIARFSRENGSGVFRFDPLLHLRYDRDPVRNAEIRAERLTPEEIVALELRDEERFSVLRDTCGAGRAALEDAESAGAAESVDDRLFGCGAGVAGFVVGYDGSLRLCGSLWHPDMVYDLRAGSLGEAWTDWAPSVLETVGVSRDFLERCGPCDLSDLCMWCPANAYLETGELEEWVEYFCAVAHARSAALIGESGA